MTPEEFEAQFTLKTPIKDMQRLVRKAHRYAVKKHRRHHVPHSKKFQAWILANKSKLIARWPDLEEYYL